MYDYDESCMISVVLIRDLGLSVDRSDPLSEPRDRLVKWSSCARVQNFSINKAN